VDACPLHSQQSEVELADDLWNVALAESVCSKSALATAGLPHSALERIVREFTIPRLPVQGLHAVSIRGASMLAERTPQRVAVFP
jgi:hypothetical protein